jgi:hypothetical protein
MPGHGSDHSSLFPGKRLPAASPERSVTSEPVWTGQNFRKRSGQNFRNPQMIVIRTSISGVGCLIGVCSPLSAKPFTSSSYAV